jgi:hypothetical protein
MSVLVSLVPAAWVRGIGLNIGSSLTGSADGDAVYGVRRHASPYASAR